MTDIEQIIFSQIKSIIANEELLIGRRGVLIPLKKAIIADGDIQNIIDLVVSDPSLSAHILWRTQMSHQEASIQSKPKTIKEALIRLGQVNIYRYAFSFYLKELFDELSQPYKKLVKGYWTLTESIAEDAIFLLHEMHETDIDNDELQTLCLFSVFGQIVALTAFARLEQDLKKSIPLSLVKSIIDEHQQSLTIEAFKTLGLDEELQKEFMIAHNLLDAKQIESSGLILRRVLSQKKLLLNPL
ncbi:HDOD domain-containing protein [Parashewanella curva]|uniref:HDOD domain-containing protein n=1 Tax=Parashewanella curva TaxID=2338552 RepID=A0A3L8PSX4_9GAMM|nr:HDOD domain-containing protein [Parashewanella curva]RLV58527.1 HDOD domain-containing protein [Parashewanella curva]